MGQKVSTSQSSSEISLSKKDSRHFKIKTKKCANWSREKINVDVPSNRKHTHLKANKTASPFSRRPPARFAAFADTKKSTKDDDDDDDTRKNADEENDANSLAYPSIAELSNITALSMMRNFEDVSLKNQVNEKSMDDVFNEKCFNTINYEDVPVVQLVENTTSLRRDFSTCTNEIKELSRESSGDDVEEKLSCKNSRQSIEETLAEKLQRVEQERDEAMSRLRLAETKCEAYEEESKCLEASMESLEEKLREIVSELRNEVSKSKDLERQLSSTFENSIVDVPPLQENEKLVSAVHS